MDAEYDVDMYEHAQVKIELDIGPTGVQYKGAPKSIKNQTDRKFGETKFAAVEPTFQSIKVEYSSDDNSSSSDQKEYALVQPDSVQQQAEDKTEIQNDIVQVNNVTREKLLFSNVDEQRLPFRRQPAEDLFSSRDEELRPRTISVLEFERRLIPLRKATAAAVAVKQRNTPADARTFTCEICDAKLTRCTTLVEHRRIHTGEKPYACEMCDLTFRRSSDLSRHKKKHLDSKSYSCDICNLKLKSFLTLKNHRRIHTGERPYRCDMCHAEFRSYNALKHHKEVHVNGS
ncbi:Adult enhancer factor 1 [Eumeta japonica]|uniref:Adult enhancer factor 1 n=1 Tax=Eumeta variegata TaxID=151549 RepID=A0A4C1WW96_EUMVA|nr:Adult enhancer factor 1 [Eumeta japonica]